MKILKQLNTFQYLMIISMIVLNALVGGLTDPLLAVSTITGVFCVVLAGKGDLANYAFGLLNAITYGIIAYHSKVYGDAIENLLFFAPTQIIGYFLWKGKLNETTHLVKARVLSLKQYIALFIAAVVSTYGFAQILHLMGGKVVYYDSATNILTVIAQFLLLFRFADQWKCWIIINAMSVITWATLWAGGDKSAPAITIMWGIYLINSIYSYYNWTHNLTK